MTGLPPYSTKHESGADWAIVDRNGIVRASGLSEEEAEETARQWTVNWYKDVEREFDVK